MQSEFDNPYAATSVTGHINPPEDELGIPESDLKKAKALVKDADQFWMAIILCLFCTAIGFVLIAPWYLSRILQWKSLGVRYPILMDAGALPKTFPYRFQRARTKMIIAIAFGGLIVGVFMFLMNVPFFL